MVEPASIRDRAEASAMAGLLAATCVSLARVLREEPSVEPARELYPVTRSIRSR
jgi:hypothetical protein